MLTCAHKLGLLTPARRLRAGRLALAVTQAVSVAVLMLANAENVGAESLGRLFFSVEERRTLDELRDVGAEPEPAPTPSGEKPVAPVVDVISFDGKVERSGGGSTIWVNGRPVFTGNRTAEGIRVQSSRGTDGETRFALPQSDTGTTNFSLKAGQKIAVQNGRKFDAYELRPDEDAKSIFEDGASPDADGTDIGTESRRDEDAPARRRQSPGS